MAESNMTYEVVIIGAHDRKHAQLLRKQLISDGFNDGSVLVREVENERD